MPEPLSANQLVAYNLMRIRKTLGLDQAQAAERLRPYVGEWSKAVYSAAERSYHGKRVRQFTADDLVALSLAFGVPVVYFFLPPRADDRSAGDRVRVGDEDVSWRDLFDVMLGGTYRSALLPRVLELPPEDRPAASTRMGQLIGLVSSNGAAVAERDRMATELRDRTLQPPIVAAIVTSSEGVLITRRVDGEPPWGFVTGKIESGESPADAAVREVKEETGLEVRIGDRIGDRVHPATGWTMIYMGATPTESTDIFVGDRGELAEVRWASLAEALELLPDMFGPVREYLATKVQQ